MKNYVAENAYGIAAKKFQKTPYLVWDRKRRDLKDYLHLFSRLCDGRACMSYSYLCTDEDDLGDASYFVFVLRLEYWAYSQAEADKYRKKLLESVKEVEENNGAGYKTYSESESLTCIVVK